MVFSEFSRKGVVAAIGLFMGMAALCVPVSAQGQRIQQYQVFNDGFDGAYLGIQMEDVTAGKLESYKLSAERGVIVRAVEKGSPAEAAKLQEDDVILEWEGVQVLSTTQLARLVRETPPGRRVELVVSRNGKKLNLQASVGKNEGQGMAGRRLRIIPPGTGGGFGYGPGDRGFELVLPDRRGPMDRGRSGAGPNDESRDQPRLGITIQPMTDQLAEFLSVPGHKGVLVASVLEGQPAFKKLRAGDVIIRADDRDVSTPEDLIQIVSRTGRAKVDLKVIRDKKEISVEITLSQSPDRPGRGYKL